MARMTKEEKRIEQEFTAAFKVHGSCVQFNIMDLGKMHVEVTTAGRAGQNIEEATKAAIAKFRQN
jgi:hypothetical protein